VTPTVRQILIAWSAIWVGVFLAGLAELDLLRYLSFAPSRLLAGDFLALLGALTYPAVHALSLPPWHLLLNLLLFYMFAPEIERMFGARRFLRYLCLATLIGAGVSLVLAAMLPEQFGLAVFGGSGWVALCFACLAAIQPGLRISLLVIEVRILHLFLVLVGIDVLSLLATAAGRGDGVSAAVHLTGAWVGWTVAGGWQRFPLFAGIRERRKMQSAERDTAQRARDEAELDRILAKISSDGIGALTPAEKRFLDQRSGKK